MVLHSALKGNRHLQIPAICSFIVSGLGSGCFGVVVVDERGGRMAWDENGLRFMAEVSFLGDVCC